MTAYRFGLTLTIMKDTLIKKLTIIIESTNYKSISSEVMKKIDLLEKSITADKELKLSYARIENKHADYVSPENWDYWPV